MTETIAIIRIRGSKETRKETELTLSSHLRLTRRMHCAVFSRDINGWLQAAKDYVTWGPIDSDTLKLLEKRKDGAVYRLHPPRGGFKKSTKIPFPRGELGKRDAESMKKLIMRML